MFPYHIKSFLYQTLIIVNNPVTTPILIGKFRDSEI